MIVLVLGVANIVWVVATRAMRLTHAPVTVWKLNAGGSFLLFAGLYLIGSFGSAALLAVCGLLASDDSMKAKVVAGFGAFIVQALLLFFVLRSSKSISIDPPVLSTPTTAAPWGILRSIFFGALVLLIAWSPLQAVGSIVASIQLYLGGVEPPVEGHTTFDLLRNSPDMMLKSAMVVIVIFCAPITEEFTFRGAMQMGIRGSGFSPWWAIIITSAFFAAVHIPVLAVGAMASGLATLFLLALILGWLMQRTGRIAAPIAAHSLFNLVNLIFFWIG